MLVLDVIAVVVASNLFILRGLSLEANGGFLLREMKGENVILRVISSLSLFFALLLISSEAWKSNGMGATHIGRFMLVGSCTFVDSRCVAAMEAFLVGDDDGTRNDGGLLLRSQGRWCALNAGRSRLRAHLGRLNLSTLNVSRSVRHRNVVERRMFESQDSILLRIKWCIKLSGVAT